MGTWMGNGYRKLAVFSPTNMDSAKGWLEDFSPQMALRVMTTLKSQWMAIYFGNYVFFPFWACFLDFCFPASLLFSFCFLLFCLLLCFYSSLLLCFSTFLLLRLSASLPLRFSAFLLFCFSSFFASLLSAFPCFFAYLFFCFSVFPSFFCFSYCR